MLIRRPLLQITEYNQIYNPYQNPPSIKKAQQHRLATKVGIDPDDDQDNVKICQCCGNYVNKKQIALTCEPVQLLFLGVGYPLFFILYRYFIAIILFIFICTGTAFNLLQTLSCKSKCVYLLKIPIVNKSMPDTVPSLPLQLVSCILILLFIIYIRKRLQNEIYQLDSNVVSPEKFSIIVQNLPEEISEEQVVDWAKEKLGVKPIIVNFAYNVSQLSDAFENRLFFTLKMNRLMIKKNQAAKDNDSTTVGVMQQSIKDIKQKIIKYDKIIDHYKHQNINCRKIGTAFLTFPQQKNIIQIQRKYETNFFHTLLNGSLSSFRDRSVKFQNVPVVIKKAPAPREIIWQNLQFSFTRYIITELVGIVVMIFVLFIAFRLQLKMATWSYKFSMYQRITPDDEETFLDVLESSIITIMIILVNYFVRYLIKIFIGIKKNYSYSRYQSSFCFYYSILSILNTCFLIYILHIKYPPRPINPNVKQLSSTKKDHILIYDIHLLILFEAFSTPLYKIIDPWMWVPIFWRKHIASLSPQKNPYSQAYVNALWEDNQISNVDNFQYIYSMLFASTWFAHVAPLGMIITGVAMMADYWITKYLLLRFCKKPENISKRIAVPLIKSLPLIPLVYICGLLQFQYKVSSSKSIFIFIIKFLSYWIVLVLIVFIIIAYYLITPPPRPQVIRARYDQVQITFDANYDTQNPMNKIKGQIKYAAYGALKNRALQNKQVLVKQFVTKYNKSSEQSYPNLHQAPSQFVKKKKSRLRRLQTMEIQMKESSLKEQRMDGHYSYGKRSSSDSSGDK